MSSYRDDMNDTLRLQGDAVSKLRSLGESTMRLRDGVEHRLQTLTEDGVALSGVFTDSTTIVRGDGMALGDEVFGGVTRRSTVTEQVRLSDVVILKRKTLVEDSIALADDTTHAVAARTTDAATFSDQVFGQRRVVHLVVDGIRLGDAAPRIAHELVAEAFVVGEAYSGKLRAKGFFSDSLALAAEDDTTTTTDSLLVERLRLSDEVWGTLHARNTVTDELALWDEVLQTGDYGQAWTASTQSWAMSRFAPFTFTSLAVIDDVLYGCNSRGVFALDGDTETMTAELRTGAMDMTGGVLAHPLEAHIEYELRGTATFDVTTTQAGTPATYSYPLNARPTADALTNARAVFGRGLRGRHFAYTLRLTGQQAYINDWSVLVAPSKRSI